MKKLLFCLVLSGLFVGFVGCSKKKNQDVSEVEQLETADQKKKSERLNQQKSNWQSVVASAEKSDFCSLSNALLKLRSESWLEEVVKKIDREAIINKTSVKFAQVILATYYSGQQPPKCVYQSLDSPDYTNYSFNYALGRLEMLHRIGLMTGLDRKSVV